MSWLDSNYLRRIPIAVQNPAGVAAGDVDTTIPADLDQFWTVIDAGGISLRVTGSDGRTILAYSIDRPGGGAFSQPLRLGRIRVQGVALAAVADSTGILWLYFDPVVAVVTGAVVTTIGTPLTGLIESALPTDRRLTVQPQPPGLSRPLALTSKTTAAEELYWLDFGATLQTYDRPVEGRRVREELRAIKVTTYDTTGAVVATIPVHLGSRFVEVTRGNRRLMLLRVKLQGGTSATRYTVEITARTCVPGDLTYRTIVHRFGLSVFDTIEPPG
jgi:hypothetical protein